ncbi:hypothetical protein VMCG_05571 [Cytospora schulzeri]|uniref:2EXR domain-containing protein n=1 Tax=Cytospora schulzeri TaxID=448051 RepID=A0A423WEU0_9PEZI|nr:hypothetical protein VMCG_05571 [Valsa malicola]
METPKLAQLYRRNNATIRNVATMEHKTIVDDDTLVKLYNDVHFRKSHPVIYDSFALFPLLPRELRLHIWLLFLQRHRMIELGIHAADATDEQQSCYYTDRNRLGNTVSGRNYTLSIKGRGYAASLSPLLRVSKEARYIALDFYRIQLPFPRNNGEQLLFVNPDYDCLYVRSDSQPSSTPPVAFPPEPRAAAVLVDFLHDVRAFDPKDQGVAHLALFAHYLHWTLQESHTSTRPPFVPDDLNPTAATSFADILRSSRLRSVFCILKFMSCMRGWNPFPSRGWRSHFAQTFPLQRRGSPAGAFDWLETDPRPGVQLDLSQVSLTRDPRSLARSWENLEKAFGVIRPEPGSETSANSNKDFSFYICPTLFWPPDDQQLPGEEAQGPPEGSREELAGHLRQEVDHWDRKRQYIMSFDPPGIVIPWHGTIIDAETFETMRRAPSTAIGIWLFPANAFKEPTKVPINCFDLSAVRPGLLLFDV